MFNLFKCRSPVKNCIFFKTLRALTRENCDDNAMADVFRNILFNNCALQKLPVENSNSKAVREVAGACFSLVSPTPVENPKLVAYSASALNLIDLDKSAVKLKDFASYFSGNTLFPGSEPASHCYCGHQFGHFAGQLGDGAAMLVLVL